MSLQSDRYAADEGSSFHGHPFLFLPVPVIAKMIEKDPHAHGISDLGKRSDCTMERKTI